MPHWIELCLMFCFAAVKPTSRSVKWFLIYSSIWGIHFCRVACACNVNEMTPRVTEAPSPSSRPASHRRGPTGGCRQREAFVFSFQTRCLWPALSWSWGWHGAELEWAGPGERREASVLICTPYSTNKAVPFQVWNRLICLLSTSRGSAYLCGSRKLPNLIPLVCKSRSPAKLPQKKSSCCLSLFCCTRMTD